MLISKRRLVTALANPYMSERYGLRKLNMSALGQTEKYSKRAKIFRSSADNRHPRRPLSTARSRLRMNGRFAPIAAVLHWLGWCSSTRAVCGLAFWQSRLAQATEKIFSVFGIADDELLTLAAALFWPEGPLTRPIGQDSLLLRCAAARSPAGRIGSRHGRRRA